MANQEWIKGRKEQLEDKAYKALDEYRKSLERAHRRAHKKIDESIYKYLERIARDNETNLDYAKKLLNARELEGLRLNLEEYTELAKNVLDDEVIIRLRNASHSVRISRLQALSLEADGIINKLWSDISGQSEMMITGLVEEGYARMISDLQAINKVPVSFSKINPYAINQLLQDPWGIETPYGMGYVPEDRGNWDEMIRGNANSLRKAVQEELIQNTMGVQSLGESAKNIARRFEISTNNAERLVKTEYSATRAKSDKKMYEDLGADQFQYLATLDNRTSATCRAMDGKIFKLEDFEVGVTAPPKHPWCRSTTIPLWGNAPYIKERAERGDDGKTYQVDGELNYYEWLNKKKY